MDFHSMMRKELQALCKKHGVPANLSNLEMANRISKVLKGKEDPLIQRPIEGQDENLGQIESADVIVNKKVKKVTFSPEHELIEFSRSKLKGRSRTNVVVSKSSNSSVVNVSCSDRGGRVYLHLGRGGRVLRSRGLKSMEGNVNGKRGKSHEKGKGKTINSSAVEILDNGKSKEGDADSSSKEMLLRGKSRPTKRAKDDGKSDNKAFDSVDNEKLIEKIVDNPGRVTRSRVQKLTEVSAKEENQRRKVAKRAGNVAQVIAEDKEDRGSADEAKLANGRRERDKSKGKSIEEDLENKIVEEHDVIEPQIVRRSERNTNRVADSEILYVDKRKNENSEGNNGLRKKTKLMTTNGSGLDGKDREGNGSEVNNGGGVTSKVEEPIKVEPRRSNRRKNVMEADELVAETENGHPSRCSVPQLGTADESSKDEKKVVQPTRVMRRLRCKTLSAKLVSEDIKFDTHLVVENLETETENSGVLGSAVEASKDEKKVIQPTGVTGRSKRKTLGVKLVSADETETKCVLRGSVPELEIAGEVSKDEKKVLPPTGVTRRSRRKTLSVKIVSEDEKVHTHLAVEKLETETKVVPASRSSVPELAIAGEVSKDEKKVLQSVDEANDTNLAMEKLEEEEPKPVTCLVEKERSAVQQSTRRSRRIASKCKSPGEIGGESVIHQKDKVIKRKGDDMNTNNKETSSKKAVPEPSSGKVANSGKRRCRLDDFKVFDASSHNDLEVGEHFVAKAQPCEDLGSTGNFCFSANTSAEGNREKKPDASITENAGNFDMKLINGMELVENAAPRNTEFKTDFEDDQISVSSIRGVEKDHLPSEVDVHELLEQNITDMDKNEVLSETEYLGCNRKMDNQVLPEGSNISGSEGFDESGSSTDSLLRGDQTDIKTVPLMEVTVAEVDICLQTSLNVVDRVGEAKGISVEENLVSDVLSKDNQVLPECSKISEQECLTETTCSADNPLLGDQTDIKTVPVMEVTEAEVDRCLQRSPNVVDRVGEAKGISVEENLVSDVISKDNQVLPECSKISEQERLAETTSSADNALLGDQMDIKTDLEVSEVEAEKCLQPNPCVVSELKVIAAHENQESGETGQVDQVLPDVSNDPGKEGSAETGSSPDNALPGDQTDIKTGVEVGQVAEVEAEKCSQSNPCVVGELKVIAAQENLDYNESGQVDQVLPEFSKEYGEEGSAESGSSADISLLGDRTDIMTNPDVAHAEADKYLQPSPNVVDHVSAVKGFSGQENLDLDESRKDNQEGLNVSGNEGFAGFLLDDQTNTTDPEVANTEGDNCFQRSPNEVDHEVKLISVQENLDFGETKQAYIGSPVSCHHIDVGHLKKFENILDNNNEEAQADAGAVESCERPIDYNQSRSIMNPKSVVMTEGNGAFFHKVSSELTGTDEDGSLDMHKSEFCIPDFSDEEISAEIVTEAANPDVAHAEADKYLQPSPNVVDHVSAVKGFSGQENLDLDESRKDNQEGLNVSGNEGFAGFLLDDQNTTDPEVANTEGDNCFQRSPNEVDHEVKLISVQENLDFGETKQAYIGSPVSCHHIDVGHLKKFENILDNNNEEAQADAGAVESCERPIDYNQSRSIMNPKSVVMTEGNGAFFHKVSSELTGTDEDGSLDMHKSEFCIPDFSDEEISAEIVPQNNLKKGHEVYSRENCTDKSSNSEDGKTVEDEFQHESKCDEFGEFSLSNLFEAEARSGIVPQEKEAFSDEYPLKDFDEPGMFQGLPSVRPTTICNSAKDHELDLIFEGHDVSICKDKQSEIVDADESDEDRDFTISNLFDGERSARIKDSNKQVAKPDVPAISTTCENFNEVEFNGSNLQEINASKPLGISESQEQLKSPLAETSTVANKIQMPDDDANDAECGKEKDDCSISKIEVEGLTDMKLQDTEETEEQSMNKLEKQCKAAIGEDSTEMKTIQSWTETELHNLFGTLDNDTPGQNVTSSSQTEAANLTSTNKSISKNPDSLTKQEIEVEGERSESEKIENEIVVLPTSVSEVSHSGLNVDAEENQLVTPIKKDETGSHGRELDRTVSSVIKCSDSMKENVEIQSKSDEDTLSDNDEGVTCEGLNEVESVEMVNISTTVLSEEQFTENTVECLKETNISIEEDMEVKVIPLRESSLYEAPGNDSSLIERNCISSSDSPRNIVQLEGSQVILIDTVLSQSITCESRIYDKTEGDMTQSSEAVFGLSNADLHMSNLPEKSNHLTACSEDCHILRETSVESFRGPIDAEIEETSIFDGTSPCLFSKLIEYDEGDSVRKDNDQCETNIWNEKDGNSRSCRDISDDNLECDHEKAKEENLTASIVQFSIPQLHFEEQAEDFNIQIHNISDPPPSECTETLKESDVADTIKEYIDSESSLSMISENSSVSFPLNETTHTDEKKGHENVALSENNEDVVERFTNTEDEVDKQSIDSLETESNELEAAAAASFNEPALASVEGSTGAKPLVETKRFDVKLDSQKQIEAEDGQNSSFKQLCSTATKNARTILIHGTPGKGPDMKENAPMGKKSNVGDVTTVRPAKRKALQDVQWK